MDDELNQLKEKQTQIGDKISLLQQTNKRKDEEAAEIRQLIQECRENLNRIKGITPGTENMILPCENMDLEKMRPDSGDRPQSIDKPQSTDRPLGSTDRPQGTDRPLGSTDRPQGTDRPLGSTDRPQGTDRPLSSTDRPQGTDRSQSTDRPLSSTDRSQNIGRPLSSTDRSQNIGRPLTTDDYMGGKCLCGSKDAERRRGQDLLKGDNPLDTDQKNKKKGKDKVSCKVDLNKMKVRIRGPSEDLKKLNATQLINLLEKFQCQELIINTGEEIIQDPGEIRLIYLMHPGNIIMAAGIIMIAFLINTNICHVECSCSKKLLLNVLYIGSFAFHYGMVMWMIFVRGYALRFGLNQDIFHLVDNVILPKYYSACVLLSALSLYSFLATHSIAPCSSWSLDVIAQIIIVVLTFFIELITICYVVPALLKLRDATEDYIIDEEEPDCDVPESYEKNLIKLSKLGWTLCLINFLTLILVGANIYYITSKLNIASAN